MGGKRRAADLRKLLGEKLNKEGFENIRQFCISTRIPLSAETVRRGFVDTGKELEPFSLVILCRYLNFTSDEIRDILKGYTDDKDIWPLLGKSSRGQLTVLEDAIIRAVKAIREAKPEYLASLADYIDLLATAAGVEVTEHTDKLRKGRG